MFLCLEKKTVIRPLRPLLKSDGITPPRGSAANTRAKWPRPAGPVTKPSPRPPLGRLRQRRPPSDRRDRSPPPSEPVGQAPSRLGLILDDDSPLSPRPHGDGPKLRLSVPDVEMDVSFQPRPLCLLPCLSERCLSAYKWHRLSEEGHRPHERLTGHRDRDRSGDSPGGGYCQLRLPTPRLGVSAADQGSLGRLIRADDSLHPVARLSLSLVRSSNQVTKNAISLQIVPTSVAGSDPPAC